jgi:hypothetical protein
MSLHLVLAKNICPLTFLIDSEAEVESIKADKCQVFRWMAKEKHTEFSCEMRKKGVLTVFHITENVYVHKPST